MKYTRNALGLLNAQYRSVLKKCLLINLGLFALGAGVSTANAAVTLSPTLDSLKEQAKDISPDVSYTLTKLDSGETLPEGAAKVTINKETYYFTPSSDKDLLQTLAGTSAGIITSEGGTPKSISFDVSKLPASVFSYADGTENDYNFVVQEVDQDGNITKKYYKVVLKTNEIGTSEAIKWSTEPAGATGSVDVKLPNSDTPTKLYYTVDESKYDPTLGTRLTDLTKNVGSATEKVLFKGLNQTSGSSSVYGGAIYNSSDDGHNIYADFIGNYTSATATSSSNDAKAYGGAIYNGENGTIGDIIGDFIGNYVSATATSSSNDAKAYGGAIYNGENGTIGDIIGDFIGNYVSATATSSYTNAYAYGGAIYNNGSIGNIIGDFIGNYVSATTTSSSYTSSSAAYGGAIYNDKDGTIDNIIGDFIDNHAEYDGAIYNDGVIGNIIGDFIDNHAEGDGAIYNDKDGSIGNITGDFINNETGVIINYGSIGNITGDFIKNYTDSYGSIYNNEKGTIGNITGDFIGNWSYYLVGAIANSGTIGNITGDFIGNYALDSGGAIYNDSSSTSSTIDNITGDFIGNCVSSNSSPSRGGAIYNGKNGIIGNISGDFSGNYIDSTALFGMGGAIYNFGTIDNITGDFIGNYVSAYSSMSNGGAIANFGTIGNITGDFIGNYTSLKGGKINNGVIFNSKNGIITIAGASTFIDNYVEVKGEKTSNAIYNLGTVNFNGTNIVVNDAITGKNGTINIASSSDGMTTFNNSVSGNTINLKQGTLKLGHYDSALLNKKYVGKFGDGVDFNVSGGNLTTQDGETHDHNLGNLNLSADLNTAIDVDLNAKTGDTLTGSTEAETAYDKKILIDNINVLADGTNHIVKIQVADANIKDVMTLANDVNIVMNPSDTNSYLVVYEKDANSGNLKFGQVDALETAVQFENANKAFAMGSDIATDTDLGALTGESLSISGNGHTIDGAGFGGMTIADNQTVSLNDVTVKGFSGAFAENNGTINLKSDTKSDIDSGIIGNGKINVAGAGEININSDIAANKMTVSGGELNLKSGSELANVENFVANGGVLNVGDQTVNLKKAEFNNGSTLAINVKSDGNGLLKAENLTINGGNLKATLGQGIVEKGSKTVTLLESNNTFTNKFADVMENNMYRFEKAEKAGDYIISLAKTAEDVSQENGGTQNNAGEAKAWVDGNKFEQGLVSADVADKLADLAQNDAKGFNEALSALAPSDNSEVRINSINHNTEMFRAVVTHLDDVSKKKQYGLSSGDAVDGVSVWAKAFGNHAKVDNTSKAYGFKSDGYGATLGIEKQLDNAFKVGLGYSYFYNDVDGFMRDSDVNTHTGFVYGEYRPNNWYTNAIASYGYSKYDENKHVAGDVYKAKYDVDNIGAQVMTGYNASVAKVDVTPEAGLRYNNIHRDNYVDSAGQAVKAETMDVMTAVAGLKVGKDLVSCFGVRSFYWRPEARLAATYDLISDKENAVVSLSNGSGYVVKGQRLNRFGVEAGAGVTFYLSPDVESSVGYEGKFRSHYQDHTGYVSAKYKF